MVANLDFPFDLYTISDIGEVTNTVTEKAMTPRVQDNGFSAVVLKVGDYSKKFYIHRLVAQYFVPNPNRFKYVEFIDGDRSNIRTSNLRWVKKRPNVRSYDVHGTSVVCVEIQKTYPSIYSLAKELDLSITAVRYHIRNNTVIKKTGYHYVLEESLKKQRGVNI